MGRNSPIVSEKESRLEPYPYVFVVSNGIAFELDERDREYLETPFIPGDGARPNVKRNYETKDPWGRFEQGFCLRQKVPKDLPVRPSPIEGRTDLTDSERLLVIAKAAGATVSDNGIGGFTISYPEMG
jgi:hypothetical protein